jgi:hypothetical protein
MNPQIVVRMVAGALFLVVLAFLALRRKKAA